MSGFLLANDVTANFIQVYNHMTIAIKACINYSMSTSRGFRWINKYSSEEGLDKVACQENSEL